MCLVCFNITYISVGLCMYAQDAYSFNHDLSPWDIDQVKEMTDMFHHAKSFEQTLCWDLSGKIVGNIFEGTFGAKADSNTSHCWDSKHSHKQPDNDGASDVDTSPTVQTAPSLGIRFLQAILCALVIIMAAYWVILVRRFLKAQINKRCLQQKVMEQGTPEDGSQHGPAGNSDTQREDDDLNCSSDDDEVEIMFENNSDIEELRRKCFSQSFDSLPDETYYDDKDYMSAEFGLPVLTTQQEESLRQLREARKCGTNATVSYTNRQLLLNGLGNNATTLHGKADTIDPSTLARATRNHGALAPPSQDFPSDELVKTSTQPFRNRHIHVPMNIYQNSGFGHFYGQNRPRGTSSTGTTADESMNGWVHQNVGERTITVVTQMKSNDSEVALRRRNGVDIV
jgi:hypothetical protein